LQAEIIAETTYLQIGWEKIDKPKAGPIFNGGFALVHLGNINTIDVRFSPP